MIQYHINRISLSEFKDVLSRYDSVVPDKLRDLDTLRYTSIPNQIGGRKSPRPRNQT